MIRPLAAGRGLVAVVALAAACAVDRRGAAARRARRRAQAARALDAEAAPARRAGERARDGRRRRHAQAASAARASSSAGAPATRQAGTRVCASSGRAPLPVRVVDARLRARAPSGCRFKQQPPRHRAPLPPGAAVADVRRQRARARSAHTRHQAPAAVPASSGRAASARWSSSRPSSPTASRTSANYKGTSTRSRCANGAVVWRYDPPAGRWPPRPAIVGDEPRRARHGRRRARARPAQRPPRAGRTASARRSSRRRSSRRDRLLRRLERPRLRARPAAPAAPLDVPDAATRSPRARRSPAATLYIGDYGGRLLALARATGALAVARSVNGRIYGTPAVAAGRVFVPSSTGGSLTAFSTGGRYLWRVRTGSYVYSSPAVWARPRLLRLLRRPPLRRLRELGRDALAVAAGGPVSGAAVVVGGVAYAGSTAGRIIGVDARTGRVVLRFPHGEYVPGLRQRRAAAAARLLADLRRRARSSDEALARSAARCSLVAARRAVAAVPT